MSVVLHFLLHVEQKTTEQQACDFDFRQTHMSATDMCVWLKLALRQNIHVCRLSFFGPSRDPSPRSLRPSGLPRGRQTLHGEAMFHAFLGSDAPGPQVRKNRCAA